MKIKLSSVLVMFLIMCLAFSINANAQKNKFSKDTIILIGKLKINEAQDVDYKIKFNINPSTYELIGWSLTDFNGPNENKSKIIGTFNPKKDEISFKEIEVVRSKKKLVASDFCYLSATLKLKKIKLLQSYTGKFVGKQVGGKEICATGEIQLMDVAKAKELMTKLISKQQELEILKANAKEEKEISKKLIVVSKGEAPKLEISGSTIKITIWDKGQIDGDKISVMMNNKFILENYTLDSTRKIIEVPLSMAVVDTIKIVALNEGKVPPNTAMIKIESQLEMYPIEVRAELNEVKNIYLQKKKQKIQ
jgi:hypothetical protein